MTAGGLRGGGANAAEQLAKKVSPSCMDEQTQSHMAFGRAQRARSRASGRGQLLAYCDC